MNIRIPLCEPNIAIQNTGQVEAFEDAIAEYTGSPFAIACNSGTSALHLALLAAGIGPGDKVIVPSLTFIATVNTVKYVRAEPIFCDCNENLNLDYTTLDYYNDIKAIIITYVHGWPKIKKWPNKLIAIEDAAQALGSKHITGGDYTCLSFNFTKIITAGGGGMILCKNLINANKMRYLINQAKDDLRYNIHNEIGFNYRMTHLQAALGLEQLKHIDEYIDIKKKNYRKYNDRISMFLPSDKTWNHWFYPIFIENRDIVLRRLWKIGIEARPLWYPCHLQKLYKTNIVLPKAEHYGKHIMHLPCSLSLTEDQIDEVVKVINE